MKSSLLQKALLFSCIVLSSAFNATAQVSQTVSIQPGYTNRTFYKMSSGTVSSVSNIDWDLGFQLRGRSGAITTNAKNNVHLWKSNKAISNWSSIISADTTGILVSSNELHNSETTWNNGAFNTTNNPANLFDLGWGLYDQVTHLITGDSIYFISLANNTVYKKLEIIQLDGFTYDYIFRYANLDGSNEVTDTIVKSAFPNKFFAYYSLVNGVDVDREPVYNAWDLSFEGYKSANVIPGSYYSVTGVLSNDSVLVAKAYPVDTASTSYNGLTYSNEINTIGFNWKYYDQTLMTYVIEDSTIYFVKDRSHQTWKVVFTGFGGSANGNFYFMKTPVSATGIIENSIIQTLATYPNPAHDHVRIMLDAKSKGDASLSIYDLSGKRMQQNAIHLNGGLQAVDMSLNNYLPGLYQVIFTQGTERQVSRIIIQ